MEGAEMKKNDQWMPLYIADYLADTQHLSAEQHGAYLMLLMQQWRLGALPLDISELAMMARIDLGGFRRRVWPKLLKFFDETPGGFVQKRLAAERAHADEVSAKRAKSGRKGAGSRWQTDAETNGTDDDNGPQGDNKPDGKPIANAMANASQIYGQRARTQPTPSQDKKEPLSSLRSDIPPSQPETEPERPSKPSRRAQVPEDWRPSERDRNFAICHMPESAIDREAAQFVDHHRSRGTPFRDVSRAWQTWCRNFSKWNRPKPTPAPRQSNLAWMHTPEPEDCAGLTIDQTGMTLQ